MVILSIGRSLLGSYGWVRPGVGKFFSRRAICGKTKSFPGRIIRWIEFNIFNNCYCQGRCDWKSKKKVYTSSDVVFTTKNIGEAVARNFKRGAIIFTIF